MIHEIRANQPSFHPVKFTPGLNVVLADRAEGSSKKDTRNGLGKSTLIEIIHFCLGAKPKTGQGLAVPALKKWEFTMDLSLGDERICITRAVAEPKYVTVSGLDKDRTDIPSLNLMGERSFTIAGWREFLGKSLFSLDNRRASSSKPSFRSLISYFVRRDHHAFGNPFSHFPKQSTWDAQIHVAFLLGLEWRHVLQWQGINDRIKEINSIRKQVKRGAVPHMHGSIGELEAERVVLSQDIENSSKSLDNFRVHPQYESIQKEANQLTKDLHAATNSNVISVRRLELYKHALKLEEPPSTESLEKVYSEMGVVFSETILRSLAKAKDFYASVVKDRRQFLETEVSRLEHSIAKTRDEIRKLTEARADLLQILNEHGALKEMVKLRELHLSKCDEFNRLTEQIEYLRQIESDKLQIARDKAELADLAARDHNDRRDTWAVPVRLFNLNSQALYEAPGSLIINLTDSGFRFRIDISKSGSDGISKMKIFCFDLSVLEFCAGRDMSIDFLVHDSEMFDGVDSRQRAAAIERAYEVTERTGTQYICALNSDMVPQDEFSERFVFDKHIRLRLTDGDPSGTLLGIIYDPPVAA